MRKDKSLFKFIDLMTNINKHNHSLGPPENWRNFLDPQLIVLFQNYGYRQRNTLQIYITHRANFIKMFFLHSKTHIIFLFQFSPNQHSLPQWILSTFHLWPFNHVINLLPTNKYMYVILTLRYKYKQNVSMKFFIIQVNAQKI